MPGKDIASGSYVETGRVVNKFPLHPHRRSPIFGAHFFDRRGPLMLARSVSLEEGTFVASKDAWRTVGAMLQVTYGKKLANSDTLNALHGKLNDLEDDELKEAVTRHTDDATEESPGGNVRGEWFPKPARLRFHVNAFRVEQAREHERDLEDELEAIKAASEARSPSKTVEFPAAAEYGAPKSLELRPTDCSECRDTGLASYFIPRDLSHPANKYRLFLEAEFLELPEAMRETFQRFPAVCDCTVGQLKRRKNPGAHEGQEIGGRVRRLYITVEEARKMAQNRRDKELARYGGSVAP